MAKPRHELVPQECGCQGESKYGSGSVHWVRVARTKEGSQFTLRASNAFCSPGQLCNSTCVDPKYWSKLQVLLNEPRADVDVELYQWRIANGLEAVDLAGLDDKDVSRAALERLAIDSPRSAALTDELDLVIRMPMRTWSRTGLAIEQEHRNTGVALLSSDKLIRTTNKRQVLLTHMMHAHGPPSRIA